MCTRHVLTQHTHTYIHTCFHGVCGAYSLASTVTWTRTTRTPDGHQGQFSCLVPIHGTASNSS